MVAHRRFATSEDAGDLRGRKVVHFAHDEDPVAGTVDLGCLPADELLESLRLTIANGLNELAIIGFDRFFRWNHQPEFRSHRDISTKAASKTSTNPAVIPI